MAKKVDRVFELGGVSTEFLLPGEAARQTRVGFRHGGEGVTQGPKRPGFLQGEKLVA
jgi:hypothetical protein